MFVRAANAGCFNPAYWGANMAVTTRNYCFSEQTVGALWQFRWLRGRVSAERGPSDALSRLLLGCAFSTGRRRISVGQPSGGCSSCEHLCHTACASLSRPELPASPCSLRGPISWCQDDISFPRSTTCEMSAWVCARPVYKMHTGDKALPHKPANPNAQRGVGSWSGPS